MSNPDSYASVASTTADSVNERVALAETPPIPDRLNLCLVIIVTCAAIGLLWLGSHLEQWLQIFVVGVIFSYVMLTNYALLHEATHNNLHSSRRLNDLLGTLTGMFFPVPFTMIHTTHQGHHLRNRTDFEMFDLYYPTDSRVLRYLQWYSILCGLFWPIVPLGGIAAAVWPGILHWRPFRQARSSSYLAGDIRSADIFRIRLEVLVTVVGAFGLFWLLELRWQNVLLMYACFSVNWSTRQYIGHAFTKRDVVEGAWNLKHNRLMDWILLHGELDLNHHRRPDVSWWYLPQYTLPDDPRPGYLQQYWRQWLGPRLATEPAPDALHETQMSVHE